MQLCLRVGQTIKAAIAAMNKAGNLLKGAISKLSAAVATDTADADRHPATVRCSSPCTGERHARRRKLHVCYHAGNSSAKLQMHVTAHNK